jgi:hypothetical protein
MNTYELIITAPIRALQALYLRLTEGSTRWS